MLRIHCNQLGYVGTIYLSIYISTFMHNIAVSTIVVKLSISKTKMKHAKFKHSEVLVILHKQTRIDKTQSKSRFWTKGTWYNKLMYQVPLKLIPINKALTLFPKKADLVAFTPPLLGVKSQEGQLFPVVHPRQFISPHLGNELSLHSFYLTDVFISIAQLLVALHSDLSTVWLLRIYIDC